jgi:predicted nucleic acid-binding protein
VVAMRPHLLDANVWLASRNSFERDHDAARRLIERADRRRFVALDLTLYEVANIAIRSWRSKRSAHRLTELVRAACSGGILRVDDALISRAIALADEYGLSAYDAAYAAAAEINGWTLVSGDHRDLVEPGLAITAAEALAAD